MLRINIRNLKALSLAGLVSVHIIIYSLNEHWRFGRLAPDPVPKAVLRKIHIALEDAWNGSGRSDVGCVPNLLPIIYFFRQEFPVVKDEACRIDDGDQ